jgi:carbamoyl-phosphate synthase large subunit
MADTSRCAAGGRRKVLVIGSGPIQIGQACEFDYSGTQACLALRDEGFDVVLVNDNPASILTDADTASVVYMEPLTPATVARVAREEGVWAVAPTFGGQVALNLYMNLAREGFWDAHGIVTLGLTPETVDITEDRQRFQGVIKSLGLEVIRGGFVSSVDDGLRLAATLEYPVIVRASFTLGGAGGGVAKGEAELVAILEEGFRVSPLAELCVEESIKGWKEFELEVMRDSQGCFLVVCGVENVNPMGVHTGDSITVSPCMTLTDVEYQALRDHARSIFDAVGLRIGGANIQFAIHPETGRVVVVEMNPRVSRSSALVSKATGYPIARIAARLAVGRSLMDLRNEITRVTSAYFEPAIDYVAVKIPLWDTHKFEGASFDLGIQMKSVGEALSFGRSFRDAFEKAWQSLERGFDGWPDLPTFLAKHGRPSAEISEEIVEHALTHPTPALFPAVKSALRMGFGLERVHALTRVSFFFLQQLEDLVELERELEALRSEGSAGGSAREADAIRLMARARQDGFTIARIARLSGLDANAVRVLLERAPNGARPTFRMVDTCAGEFEARTPFFYKTFETDDENVRGKRERVVIPGSGPNRIGQGVEFDTSCVHAVRAARAAGYEAVMVNSNPETVSTDFLTPDKLFMEPLSEEGLLDVLEAEQPHGVFLQFGGQSPLKLAEAVKAAGWRILGTPLESIRLAEDREAFGALMDELGVAVPRWETCLTPSEGFEKGLALGFPLLVRPSFVLGGQSMEIVREPDALRAALGRAHAVGGGHPVLIDCYLEGAREYDVDALCDGVETFVPAVMEHLEEAGIHSGDSASVIPPRLLAPEAHARILDITRRVALRLGVKGLLNVQLAVRPGAAPGAPEDVFVLEVNPRSSRSVPFVSKAMGVPMAFLAARVALGTRLEALREEGALKPSPAAQWCVKTPVFPFHKFPGVLPVLGPQMQSIGETMSLGASFEEAMAKSYAGQGVRPWRLRSLFLVAAPEAIAHLAPALLEMRASASEAQRPFKCHVDAATAAALAEAGVLEPADFRVAEASELVHALDAEDRGAGSFVLCPTLVGVPSAPQKELAHRLLRAALRKRIPFTNSCRAAAGLAAALRAPGDETTWTLVPLSRVDSVPALPAMEVTP